MILVTKPFMPPFNEVQSYLEKVWEREWLTNDGPLYKELNTKLESYLDSCPLILMTNGTITLQIALKALNIEKKEILTTPFSYIASMSSIVWENYKPVFVDINPDTLNVDASLIEAKINENTGGMLFTHVFGNICDIDKIDELSSKYDLPVIYDAAHAFGVKYKGRSIFDYGTISSCSFHATKLFHTVEGGALFSTNSDLLGTCNFMKKFGHDGPEKFASLGINGKLSEMHSAVGLVNLNYIDRLLEKRKEQYLLYVDLLQSSNSIKFQKLVEMDNYNYSYFPVVFKDENTLLKVKGKLEANNIFPRRYFYPSLNTVDYLEYQSCPISEDISSRILCLPLYDNLLDKEIKLISELVLESC